MFSPDVHKCYSLSPQLHGSASEITETRGQRRETKGKQSLWHKVNVSVANQVNGRAGISGQTLFQSEPLIVYKWWTPWELPKMMPKHLKGHTWNEESFHKHVEWVHWWRDQIKLSLPSLIRKTLSLYRRETLKPLLSSTRYHFFFRTYTVY